MTLDADSFLEHYGVMGMRWGQRKEPRVSNRTIKKDFDKTQSAELERLKQKYDLASKQQSADEYERKTGTTPGYSDTKEARAVTRKFDSLFALESRIHSESYNTAAKAMVKKYGQKRYDRMQKIDAVKSVALITSIASIPLALILADKLL